MDRLKNSTSLQVLFFIVSCLIVSFGQPAWSASLSIISALCGYALVFLVIVNINRRFHKLMIGTLWFTTVQWIQLSWLLSHPFLYIYAAHLLFSLVIGTQFGIFCLFITPNQVTRWSRILLLSSLWTLFEWSRLFYLSGFSWNPAGLTLAGNIYSRQVASLVGTFGLSFLVMFINLSALRTFLLRFTIKACSGLALAAAAPFVVGAFLFALHEKAYHDFQENRPEKQLNVLLIQTGFPVEEVLEFQTQEEYFQHVLGEWKKIFTLVKENRYEQPELIVLPELVVPFGTYTFIYPFDVVMASFKEIFGSEDLSTLPNLELPLAVQETKASNSPWYVNNAYWVQALANLCNASIVVGLEDAEDHNGDRCYYSSAVYVQPSSENNPFLASRYEKRILVPMGEYIPFQCCRDLCAHYGVLGSFTKGEEAKVWTCNKKKMGVSICYEETFGDLMRENKVLGAECLLNLTSDAWFPNSMLPRQHLEHSRLRTVENGFPLIRSCNTGITCAIDAFGRDIAELGTNDSERQNLSGSLFVKIPLYHYKTLYSIVGDGLIIGMSLLNVLALLRIK